MPLHIQRIGTVYSLQQLEEDEAGAAVALPPPPADGYKQALPCSALGIETTPVIAKPPQQLTPNCMLLSVSGALMPKYSYVCSNAPKRRKHSPLGEPAVVPDAYKPQ